MNHFICLLVPIVVLCGHLSPPQCVLAHSPQQYDKLAWGGKRWSIIQTPLESQIREAEKREGKSFLDVTTPSNWKGYTASWGISNGKLYLEKFAATADGKPIPVSKIVGANRLPVHADWYSGTLQLPIGEFDYDKQSWPIVIEVTVKNGKLIEINGTPGGDVKY